MKMLNSFLNLTFYGCIDKSSVLYFIQWLFADTCSPMADLEEL